MEIVSHRGFWNSNIPKNSKAAFENSFKNEFGTETDLRDLNGEIVISHDIPRLEENPITLKEFFEIYTSYKIKKTLCLNIKADGLQLLVKELINKFQIENYFLFDMSIPDHIQYNKIGLKTFFRESEYEKTDLLTTNFEGVWLDAFINQWYNYSHINSLLEKNLKVAIVSFDLHKRDYEKQWQFLKENNFHLNKKILLCTDTPDKAIKYFYEK